MIAAPSAEKCPRRGDGRKGRGASGWEGLSRIYGGVQSTWIPAPVRVRKPRRVHSPSCVRRSRGLTWSCWASPLPLQARRRSVFMISTTRDMPAAGSVREVFGSRRG